MFYYTKKCVIYRLNFCRLIFSEYSTQCVLKCVKSIIFVILCFQNYFKSISSLVWISNFETIKQNINSLWIQFDFSGIILLLHKISVDNLAVRMTKCLILGSLWIKCLFTFEQLPGNRQIFSRYTGISTMRESFEFGNSTKSIMPKPSYGILHAKFNLSLIITKYFRIIKYKEHRVYPAYMDVL